MSPPAGTRFNTDRACQGRTTSLEGANSTSFTVNTKPVALSVIGSISATSGGATKATSLVIKPPVLKSLALNPATVVGGYSSRGTVALTGPAPVGGVTIALTSSSTSAGVPLSVLVLAGKTSVSFTVTTLKVKTSTSSDIEGKQGSIAKIAQLMIGP